MARTKTISKEKIINIGLQIVKKEGIENLNARHLADDMGMTTTPIFANFGSMVNLTNAIWKKAKTECDNYLLESKNYPLPFKEFGMRFLNLAIDNQNIFKFVFMTPFSGDSIENDKAEFFSVYKPVFEKIHTPFNLSKEAVIELVHVLSTFTLGLAVNYIICKEKPDRNEYSIMLTEVFEAMSSYIADKGDVVSTNLTK